MPAEIVTVGFCPQYHSRWQVAGSKPGTSYEVDLAGAEGAPHCTCKAFQFSGGYGDQDCKHVRAVWAHACLYNPQWKDAGPNDFASHGIELVDTDTAYQYGEPCPGCGGPMIATKIAV